MKLKDIMTDAVISIQPEEPVAVAARTLERYNIGILPVCKNDKLCGVVTDRDIVVRCLASGRTMENTTVSDVMTRKVINGNPEMDAAEAAELMGREQIRRLPVVADGKICGMISLGDLAREEETGMDAEHALAEISSNEG